MRCQRDTEDGNGFSYLVDLKLKELLVLIKLFLVRPAATAEL